MVKTKYQVIFQQGNYSNVDAECDDYESALERYSELQAEMYIAGERNFCYIIKKVTENVMSEEEQLDYCRKHGKEINMDVLDDDILEDSDFNTLCGR